MTITLLDEIFERDSKTAAGGTEHTETLQNKAKARIQKTYCTLLIRLGQIQCALTKRAA